MVISNFVSKSGLVYKKIFICLGELAKRIKQTREGMRGLRSTIAVSFSLAQNKMQLNPTLCTQPVYLSRFEMFIIFVLITCQSVEPLFDRLSTWMFLSMYTVD